MGFDKKHSPKTTSITLNTQRPPLEDQSLSLAYGPIIWRTTALGTRSLIAFTLSSTYVVFEKKFGNSSASLLLSRNRLGKITCDDRVSKAFNIFFNARLPSVPWNSIPMTERLVTDKFSQIKENLFCNISQPKAEIVLETFFPQKIGQYCPSRACTHSTHIPKRVVSLQKMECSPITFSIILLNSMNIKLYGCCELTITYCSFVSILVRFALSFKVRRFTWRWYVNLHFSELEYTYQAYVKAKPQLYISEVQQEVICSLWISG